MNIFTGSRFAAAASMLNLLAQNEQLSQCSVFSKASRLEKRRRASEERRIEEGELRWNVYLLSALAFCREGYESQDKTFL